MPDGPVALRASAVVNGRVYLFGGCRAGSAGSVHNSDEAWEFDPTSKSWKKLQPLNVAVRSLSAVAMDNRHLLLGGGYNDSGFSDTAQVYKTKLDRYESAVSLPFKSPGLTLVRHAGLVFGLGGKDRMRGRSRR